MWNVKNKLKKKKHKQMNKQNRTKINLNRTDQPLPDGKWGLGSGQNGIMYTDTEL